MKKENSEKLERVIVHVRMRPFLEEELMKDKTSPIEEFNEIDNSINIKKDYDKKYFKFDTISNINSNQLEIFNKTSKEVIDVRQNKIILISSQFLMDTTVLF